MDISEFSRLNDKRNYNRHPWETSRKNVLHTFLKKSKIKFPLERIVDIGSGDAFVIHSLYEKKLAKNYYAIDTAYSDELVSQLDINYGHSEVKYIFDLKTYQERNPETKSTLYLCMDVLEHLEDEKIILGDLQKKENNYYFFAVPAFQSVFSSHDELLGHYRRYSLEQLKSLLVQNDFEIIDKGYYFTTLLLFRNIDKILKKDKNESIDNWEGGKFKTFLINATLHIDFQISLLLKKIGITIPGLSAYCLCKK